MSTLKSNVIEPATGTTLTLGAAGDTLTLSSDSLQTNLYKDAGANTIFQSDGAGTLSNINSGLRAGPVLILSQTASNSATVDFTANLDSTYNKYMFIWVDVNPASNGQDFGFQVSTDGGSNYNVTTTSSTFRAYKKEADDSNSGVAINTSTDQEQGTGYQAISHWMGNGSDQCASGILYLCEPSSTTYVKQYYSQASVVDGSSATHVNNWFTGGYFNTTTALNAISFKMVSGNFDGTIKMYGIV